MRKLILQKKISIKKDNGLFCEVSFHFLILIEGIIYMNKNVKVIIYTSINSKILGTDINSFNK